MYNDLNITYHHPYDKTGAEATESVFMLNPNDDFMRLWQQSDNKQASEVVAKKVLATVSEIQHEKKVDMSLPHLIIDRDEGGKLGVNFIDGRHRTMAYRELNKQIPVLIETDLPGKLEELPELKNILSSRLPTKIKSQLEGGEGRLKMPEDEASLNYIRKWAKENEDKLRKILRAKHGGFVGDKATEFYIKHGKQAPPQLIETWKGQALQQGHSVEPDLEAATALNIDRLHADYAKFVGAECADTCVAIHLATGKPIHRDTIDSVKDGLNVDEAIRMELASIEHQEIAEQQRGPNRFKTSPSRGGGFGMGSR